MSKPLEGLQLTSNIRDDRTLAIGVRPQMLDAPAADELVIAVQATPLNHYDFGLLFGPANMDKASVLSGKTGIQAPVCESALQAMAGRLNQAMPVGNEGTVLVVAAGNAAAAQELIGKTSTVFAWGMYAQYRLVKASQCMVLPEGETSAQRTSHPGSTHCGIQISLSDAVDLAEIASYKSAPQRPNS